MSDVEVRESRDIVVPGTAEIVNLDDAPAVARALAAVREHKARVDEVRGMLEDALVDEAGRQGSKTLRFGSVTASIGADSELEWDITVLPKLLEAGLPQDRYDELVQEVVSYKINASVANQISAANDVYASIIDEARSRRPKRAYVKVEVAP